MPHHRGNDLGSPGVGSRPRDVESQHNEMGQPLFGQGNRKFMVCTRLFTSITVNSMLDVGCNRTQVRPDLSAP